MKAPLFLERGSYRRRRIVDASRILPLLGAFLWCIPLLWGDGQVSQSRAMVYIFGVWALLILSAGMVARRLPAGGREEPAASEPADGTG